MLPARVVLFALLASFSFSTFANPIEKIYDWGVELSKENGTRKFTGEDPDGLKCSLDIYQLDHGMIKISVSRTSTGGAEESVGVYVSKDNWYGVKMALFGWYQIEVHGIVRDNSYTQPYETKVAIEFNRDGSLKSATAHSVSHASLFPAVFCLFKKDTI